MLNITKVIDQWGWAYSFIAKDMAKYSKCRIIPQKYNEINYDKQDIILISGPNIDYNLTAIKIPNECKEKGIKVIGQYSGEVDIMYSYADLIVTISPQLYLWAKDKYKNTNIPVIFLPESIDTNYFQPSEHSRRFFNIGWAGGANKVIKRTRLFEQLNYPVQIKSDHGHQYFREGRNQEPMKTFYSSIDVFINMSETECMSRVILEAMASGLPIISTDVGGTRLLIPDEYIIPVFPEKLCIDEMNKKLEELANNFELRDAIGKVNRAWCEKCWSWEVNMPLWDEIFYYVHTNNFKKIEELNESIIAPFKKFFEPCEKYTQQIKNFSKMSIDSRKIKLQSDIEKFAHITLNLITDLNKYEGDFWLARETCLDTINHEKIQLKPGTFYLGVKSIKDQEKLSDFIRNLGAIGSNDCSLNLKGLNISILIEEVKETKFMTLYGRSTKVPSPVVPYLSDRFGHLWRTK